MNICRVDGCNEKVHSKGFCNKHFCRYRRLGDPLAEVKEQGERLPVEMKDCECCGKEFKPKRDRRRKYVVQKYCSPECAASSIRLYDDPLDKPTLTRPRKIYPINCSICGKVFIARNKATRVCPNDECKKKEARQKAVEYDKRTSNKDTCPRNCKECGKLFEPVYGMKRRVFCSEECSTKHSKKAEWYKAMKKRNNRTRRARINSVPSIYYNDKDIFVRDGWVCGICGETVDENLIYPNPLSASIDHILPLSKRGCDTPDNVQLAHLICNSIKRDQII